MCWLILGSTQNSGELLLLIFLPLTYTITAISWPPPLILQLFHTGHLNRTDLFTVLIKCRHSVCVSFQLLVSVHFIAVPKILSFSPRLVCVLFQAMQLYSYAHNRKHAVAILNRQDNGIVMI